MLSEKGRRTAWQRATFAPTQSALVTPVDFGRLSSIIFSRGWTVLYHLFCVPRPPPKMLTLQIQFSLSSCFSCPVFQGELLFFMAVATGCVFTSPQRTARGTDGISEVAPGSPGGLSRHSCFLLKYFQFGRFLVLLESLPWLCLGSRLVWGADSLCSLVQEKVVTRSAGREALRIMRQFPYPSSECVRGSSLNFEQKGPHSCPHAAVPCIRSEGVSVFWISLGRIVCHITIWGHKSGELSGSLQTANGVFMSWFRCALMLSFSSLDIMRAAEDIQTWFPRVWVGEVKTQPAQPRSIAMLCIIINDVQAVA